MNKKKAALAALALTLVGGIGTTGTLAYLTARQSEKDGNGVVNTFSIPALILLVAMAVALAVHILRKRQR